jgi:hypothetical protein
MGKSSGPAATSSAPAAAAGPTLKRKATVAVSTLAGGGGVEEGPFVLHNPACTSRGGLPPDATEFRAWRKNVPYRGRAWPMLPGKCEHRHTMYIGPVCPGWMGEEEERWASVSLVPSAATVTSTRVLNPRFLKVRGHL